MAQRKEARNKKSAVDPAGTRSAAGGPNQSRKGTPQGLYSLRLFLSSNKRKEGINMTFVEKELTDQEIVDIFRAIPDDIRPAFMMSAQLLPLLPASERQEITDSGSESRRLLHLFDKLSADYRSRLTRYAEELTAIQNRGPDDPDSVQTSVRHPEEDEILRCGEKMENAARKAEIPLPYQLTLREMQYLYLLTQQEKSPSNAVCLAFDYGFVKGNRATRRGRVKAL